MPPVKISTYPRNNNVPIIQNKWVKLCNNDSQRKLLTVSSVAGSTATLSPQEPGGLSAQGNPQGLPLTGGAAWEFCGACWGISVTWEWWAYTIDAGPEEVNVLEMVSEAEYSNTSGWQLMEIKPKPQAEETTNAS